MNADLEERVWAYLDGELDDVEIGRFERDLLNPHVAQVFSETLMLRELLRADGPDDAPAEWIAETEKAVLRDAGLPDSALKRRLFGRTRAALNGMAWALRGPSLAAAGGLDQTRDALSEIGHTKYSLGPLADMSLARDAEKAAKPRRSLLRRMLRRGK